MALDTSENRLKLCNTFPDLVNDVNFKILSEPTPIYNCIAWAMGITDKWVDTMELAGHWWPEGVERNQTPNALIHAFQAVGFEETDGYYPEAGYRKVILYMDRSTNHWTHASLVVSAQIEHSKFGEAWNAHHSHNVLKSNSPNSYGEAYAFMRRHETSITIPLPPGHIEIDLTMLKNLKDILLS